MKLRLKIVPSQIFCELGRRSLHGGGILMMIHRRILCHHCRRSEAMPQPFQMTPFLGRYSGQASVQQEQFTGLQFDPFFVVRQGLRGDHRHPVVGRRDQGKIDRVIHIAQVTFGKGGFANGIVQSAPNVGTTGAQKVQNGPGRIVVHNFLTQGLEGGIEFGQTRQSRLVLGPKGVQNGTKSRFAVGGSHGLVDAGLVVVGVSQGGRFLSFLLVVVVVVVVIVVVQIIDKQRQVSIVRKGPLDAGPFADVRMHVGQIDVAVRRVPNVGHHVEGPDGIRHEKVGQGTLAGRLVVVELAESLVLVKGQAPAVGVNVRVATAATKALKGKGKIRGAGAVHAQQLTPQRRCGCCRCGCCCMAMMVLPLPYYSGRTVACCWHRRWIHPEGRSEAVCVPNDTRTQDHP